MACLKKMAVSTVPVLTKAVTYSQSHLFCRSKPYITWYIAEVCPILIHCRNIPYLRTLPSDFAQKRKAVGSQLESTTKNPKASSVNQNWNWVLSHPKTHECSRLALETILGSRLQLARSNLPKNIGSPTPPPPPHTHTHTHTHPIHTHTHTHTLFAHLSTTKVIFAICGTILDHSSDVFKQKWTFLKLSNMFLSNFSHKYTF